MNGSTLGWALVGVSAGAVVVGMLVLARWDIVELIGRLADPSVLATLLVVNLGVAGVRFLATTDAWRRAGGRNLLSVLVLAALVIAPHAALGWVGHEARLAFDAIFASPAPPPRTPGMVVTSPITTTSSTTTAVSTTTTTPLTATTSPTTTAPTVTTSTTLPAAPRFTERITFLLLGGDAGPGRPGLRTDTIMVATIDPVTGAAAIFGIPRNFGGVSFSDGTPFEGRLINEVYGWGTAHPEVFGGPDPGAAALADVVEHLTGLTIDHTVLVDLTGFGAVIDAFGGVEIDVPVAIEAPLYDPSDGSYTMIRIPRGPTTFNGHHALAYVRSRTGSDDYDRMGRQRCLLAALAHQATPVRIVRRLPAILGAIADHVTTDIPVESIPDLLALEVGSVRMLGFDPSWRSGWTEDRVAVPDVVRIRAAIAEMLEHPAEPSSGDGLSTGCRG